MKIEFELNKKEAEAILRSEMWPGGTGGMKSIALQSAEEKLIEAVKEALGSKSK